jgi:electron transfer flavoprotein alpha/beta subunit
MKAKQKPLEIWNRETIGVEAGTVGAAGAQLKVVHLELPAARPVGRIIPGDAAAAVKELVRLLREEAQVV